VTLKNPPENSNLLNCFSAVAGYKINSNKSVAFHYTKEKQAEKKLAKQHLSQQSQII
jgi:lipopolysaccharide assembly outer membrane protein LptD (OstA)